MFVFFTSLHLEVLFFPAVITLTFFNFLILFFQTLPFSLTVFDLTHIESVKCRRAAEKCGAAVSVADELCVNSS